MTLALHDDSLSVLLIDDSEDDGLLIERALRGTWPRLRLQRAETPAALEAVLKSDSYDLVLCDHNMPQLNPVEVLHRIRQYDEHLPVVMISGSVTEETLVQFMRAGARDLIPKDRLFRLTPAVAREITESRDRRVRRVAVERLRDRERVLSSIAANIPGSLYRRIQRLDGSGSYPYVEGDYYRRLFGYDPKEFVADPSFVARFVHPDDQPRLASSIARSAATLEPFDVDIRIRTADGTTRWLRTLANPNREGDGSIVWDGMTLDITEHKEMQERLSHLLHYDALTGLPNRRQHVERIEEMLPQAKALGVTTAVLCIGLDRFKAINNSLGREIGDTVLREAAGRLAVTLREQDAIARLGGDEFSVVIPDLRDAEEIKPIIKRLFETLTPPIQVAGEEVRVTACIGAALYPNDGENAESLLKSAEAALHRAKREGTRMFQYYDPQLFSQATSRFQLEKRLRRAVEREEFEIYYQPQINLREGRVVGVEALVRWFPEGEKPVSPALFIPIAEELGLISEIGEFVLRRSCEQVIRWHSEGLPLLRMAVNVSGQQLRDGSIIPAVAQTLRDTGLDAKLLKLELTESAIMATTRTIIEQMNRLRDMNVSLAIDDFGTGYSSLNYLSRFPIDTLKVDRSFIVSMTDDATNAGIVDTIIKLAHVLRMNVVAEGVDSGEQVTYLRAYRCEEVQGFLFSPPVPADEIPALLVRPWLARGGDNSRRH